MENTDGSCRRVDAGDKDQLITELKDRIAVLENELRFKQEDASSTVVTERKDALRMAGDEFELGVHEKLILDNINAAIAFHDAENNFVWANKTYMDYVGVPMSELKGRKCYACWGVDRLCLNCPVARAIRTGEPQEGEMTPENQPHWPVDQGSWLVRAAPVRDSDGKIIGAIELVHNITGRKRAEDALLKAWNELEQRVQERTLKLKRSNDNLFTQIDERKRAEEMLRQAHDKLQATLDSITDGLLILDHNWRYTYFSEVGAKLIGMRREDLIGGCVWELFPYSRDSLFYKEYHRAVETGQPTHFEEYYPEPINKWLECHCYPGVEGLSVYFRDVTERKRAEEALAAAYRQFQSIIDNTPALVYAFDLEERFVLVNTACAELLNSTREQIIGKRRHEFMPRENADWHEANDRQAIEAGKALEFEEYSQLKGRSITWLTTKFPLRDTQGRIYAVAGISTDISERKRAEEALRNSERLYRAIGESIDYGVWVCAPDGRNIYASESFLKLVGMTQQQCSDFGWGGVLHPEDAERTLAAWKECVRTGGNWDIEHRYRGADSLYHPILARGVPVKDEQGNVIYWAGINLDISNIKRAEEALRESDERFRALADNIPNLAWMANADGWIFWYNKQWYDYTGTTLEEMQGWGWQKVHHPDHIKSVMEEWSASIKAGELWEDTFPLRGKDGNYRWFLSRATPIKDEHGKIRRWFGTNTDITERMRVEDELKDAKMQSELYLDLMGHDISNMHQIIVGHLGLAQEVIDLDGKLGREDKEMIDTSLRTLQRSIRLIDNVRNLQKLRADNVKLERIDLGEVLDEAVKGYIGLPGRDISIDYNSVHGFFITANQLIKDVFNNLLDNAVKHCDDPVKIHVAVNAVDGNGCRLYEVAVEDNGHGIPDDKKAEIFNRLKRGETKARGTGLGLYIVKTLVEGFGGSVKVEDRVPGDHTKGARFVLLIPADGGGRKIR